MHEYEYQQNRRIDASRAFMESLDQLQNILAQERQTAESESQSPENTSSNSWSNLKLLEEAAADLDEFFGEQEALEEE
ncbi:MAG TPA: hypothetical protein V6D14_34370 [Coleofasciculaceae cyanobacterium]|jgi:hypothetical protein